MNYFRIHANYTNAITGKPAGIFAVLHRLQREGRLTEGEVQLFHSINTWYMENVTIPPFYKDGNPLKAICWFKDIPETNHIIEHLKPLIDILNKYGIGNAITRSSDPGTVIYEDDLQIATE
jgi:hypothetical protein